jgi:hypothetical protein
MMLWRRRGLVYLVYDEDAFLGGAGGDLAGVATRALATVTRRPHRVRSRSALLAAIAVVPGVQLLAATDPREPAGHHHRDL